MGFPVYRGTHTVVFGFMCPSAGEKLDAATPSDVEF